MSSLLSLAPLHLLSYSSMLGMSLYQTFIITGLSYRALPLPHFRSLQKRLFPAYFTLQVVLAGAIALTSPPPLPLLFFFSRARAATAGRDVDVGVGEGVLSLSLSSVLSSSLLPLGAMVVTAALNRWVWGPRCVRAMLEVVHQETRDGGRGVGAGAGGGNGVKSEEMKLAMRRFSSAHAMSIHLNLVTVAATLWYGLILAAKLSDGGMAGSGK